MGKSVRNPSDNDPVIRPGTIIMTLILMGISTLFAGLCAAYLYTVISVKVETPRPPLLFLINIPVLIAATIFIKRSLRDFDERQYRNMLMNLVICLALSLVFITLQIHGWTEFFKKIPLTASQSRSFLFVLSALHLLHIIAGFPFLLRFIWMNSGVLNDLRFQKSERRQFLKGLIRYWNYLDILWMLLVLVLSIGFAIRWL
jgi:heme/copper-type cytochrome/quinol oxidase subunit 3